MEPDEIVRVPGAGGREGAVQIVEGEHVVVDMGHPGARDWPPAIADIGPRQFEPPEERRRVDSVERHVVAKFRGDAPVVIGQHVLEPTLADQEQGEMPAVVARHEVRVSPIRPGPPEERHPLICATRRLHDVGDRMRRPCVARVAGERFSPGVLRRTEVARLLEPERVGAEHEARERIIAPPGGQDALSRVADRERPAEEQIGVLAEPECEGVGRPVFENGFPNLSRFRRPSLGPCPDRGEVHPLARRGAAHRRLSRGKRLRHFGMVATKTADQEKTRDCNRAKRKIPVVPQRLPEDPNGISS